MCICWCNTSHIYRNTKSGDNTDKELSIRFEPFEKKNLISVNGLPQNCIHFWQYILNDLGLSHVKILHAFLYDHTQLNTSIRICT